MFKCKTRITLSKLHSKKTAIAIFLLAVIGVMLSFPVLAQDNARKSWTQFRGNMRNGISTESGLLEEWPESGLKPVWKKETGQGFSEVVVLNNVAYLMACDTLNGGYEYLTASDVNSGKELWKIKIDSLYIEIDGWGHGPRSTPAVDNEKIYCLSGLGKLAAYSNKTGKEVWAVNLPEKFGSPLPRWGFSSSPILINGILIIETGGPESKAFTAFDKDTGKTLWSKGTGSTTYNSPAIATIEGKTHIVFANDTMLYSFDPEGNENWTYRMPMRSPIPMPVFIPPNRFFLSSVSRTGSFIIEVKNNEVSEVLKSKTMQNNFNSSCYHNGYLYGFSRAKLQCVSAETGERKWSHRGFGQGSLIIVNDKLLVLSDQGLLTVVEAKPDEFKALNAVQAMEGKSWTAPSFANGKVFVRNLTHTSCYQLAKVFD
ncbi:MAG: PQQ-binding-like beta-propeller repeat protein [Bacteroidota bacterium]|nr:PQQ-binding-like beta-propeller repeat protein [Bacteroidota bacterium]